VKKAAVSQCTEDDRQDGSSDEGNHDFAVKIARGPLTKASNHAFAGRGPIRAPVLAREVVATVAAGSI